MSSSTSAKEELPEHADSSQLPKGEEGEEEKNEKNYVRLPQEIRIHRVSLVFMIVSLTMIIIQIFLPSYLRKGTLDLQAFVTTKYFYYDNYTFSEALLDFGHILGEFWNCVIFTLVIGGYVLIYQNVSIEFHDSESYDILWRKIKGFLFLAVSIIVIAFLGHELNWGLVRNRYEIGGAIDLILYSYGEQWVAHSLLSWIIWLGGAPALLTMLLYGTQRSFSLALRKMLNWRPGIAGIKYLILGIILIEYFVMVYPLTWDEIFSSDAITRAYWSIIDMLFIIGSLGLYDAHTMKVFAAVNNVDEEILEDLEKAKKQYHMEILRENKDGTQKKIGVITRAIAKFNVDVRLTLQTIRFGLVFFVLVIGIIIGMVLEGGRLDYTSFRALQHILLIIFRTSAVAVLFFLERLRNKMKILNEVKVNG